MERVNEQPKVPIISDERLSELAARIMPVVEDAEGLSYIAPVDLRKIAFTWSPERTAKAEGLEELTQINTYHTYGAPVFFKPSIAEVLSQIPEQYLEDTVAFKTDYAEIVDSHHLAKTTLYRHEQNPQTMPQRAIGSTILNAELDQKSSTIEPPIEPKLTAAGLARQIGENPAQLEGNNVSREDLSRLIDRCSNVYRKLESQHFEETNSGWTSFYVSDSSDGDYSGIIASGVEVYFNNYTGMRTKIGRIHKDKSFKRARAEAYTTETQTEPLYPGDPRWDVIVGSLARAVAICRSPFEQSI